MYRQHVSSVDPETIWRCEVDADAVEQVYRACWSEIWGYVARRARDPHEAADVVADVFADLPKSARRFDPRQGSPVAWLIGIAARRFLDGRRREAREGRALARSLRQVPLTPGEAEQAAERIDAARAAARVRGDVLELPESEREVLLLVAYDDLTPAEAASVLGISSASARMRLSRARRRLKRVMENSPTAAASAAGGPVRKGPSVS